MENIGASEETEATNMPVDNASTNDAADGVTSDTLEEEEQATSTEQGDVSEDEDFGDFAAATHSSDATETDGEQSGEPDVAGESDEKESKAVLDEQAEDAAEDDGFGNFKAPPDNKENVVMGGGEEQLPPHDADDPFAHLSTNVISHEAAIGESASLPNDEATEDVNAVVLDENEESSPGECAGHASALPPNDSDESASENGIESDNNDQVKVVLADSDDVDFTPTQDSASSSVVDETEKEKQTSPSDAFDDPFAHLSTGVDESEPNMSNDGAEEVIKVASDNEQDSSPEDNIQYFSTHPPNDSAESASENAIEESESGQESSSPDNDAGYFSAVTDGDDNEENTKDEEQTEKLFESPENEVQSNTNTEGEKAIDSDTANDNARSDGTESEEKAAGAGRLGTESSSSTDIDATREISDTSNDAAADDSSGDFGCFEQVNTPVAQDVESEKAEGDASGTNYDIAVNMSEGLGSTDAAEEVETIHENTKEEDAAITGTGDDDEGFGDFGSFEQPQDVADEIVADSQSSNAASPENEPDDDDFGDFGSFEQADTQTPETMVQSQQGEDDDEDFGDFGDFTDFASETPTQENPPSVNSEAANPAVPPSQPPATTVVDPIVNKAEIIFRDVFARAVAANENDHDSTERIVVKVNTTLVRNTRVQFDV